MQTAKRTLSDSTQAPTNALAKGVETNSTLLPERPNIFLTDGGLETTLIFDDGLELPHFAAFTLLRNDSQTAALEAYYERYIAIAKRQGTGFILESPTWRANADWGDALGYSKDELSDANFMAVGMLMSLKDQHDTPASPMMVSGCVGPRGDGYIAGEIMSPADAEEYHNDQISVLAAAGVDLITAITMTNANEAIGIARAALSNGTPSVISFTVETDGRLPSGQTLKDAITQVDDATSCAPAYYMINCAHPSHFRAMFNEDAAWPRRIGGVRANASCKSHAELDAATELDRGNPIELATEHADLYSRLPSLRVFGGCCGTDHRHIAAISSALDLIQPNQSLPRL